MEISKVSTFGLPQAVGLSKVSDVRSRDSARVLKNAEETPGNLEGCEADERPCPDRGLDPPLELYCL